MTGRGAKAASLAGAVVLTWSALSLAAVPVGADSIFNATADAAAVRTSFADPAAVPLLTGGGTDVTSPRAQAVGNSLGTSTAFASALYPGHDIAALADLLGLFIPPSVPITPPTLDFPLTVTADSDQPAPEDQTSPGYRLHAAITVGGDAASQARSGASPMLSPGGSSVSDATVSSQAGDGVRAVASTRTTGFGLPGLIEIASVTTTATAARTSNGVLSRGSDMTITGAEVLGLPLELRNGSFVVPVLDQSLDINAAIQQLPVLAPLKEQGVTLEYQAAVNSPNGVTAPGIRITWVHDIPALPLPPVPLPPLTPGQPNVGPIPPSRATVTYSLGFATASASMTSFPAFSPGPTSGGDSFAPGPVQAIGGTLAPLPGSGTGSGPVAPDLGLATSPATPPGPAAAPTTAALSSASPVADLGNIYLVLVVAGLLALGLGQLLRFQGVRTAQAQ